jgi:hypothetical protein
VPPRIRRLPIARGYPVPWFVAWLDEDGLATTSGQGTPDFRIIRPGGVAFAHNNQRCWICGDPLGSYKTFTIGPMCAVNRTSAEPPSHLDCSDWSARACPFLARPQARRRDAGRPEGTVEAPGIALMRNPGVALVWTTRKYKPVSDGMGGVLFNIGEPTDVRWYAEGREATRDEVLASINSGLPSLRELAEQERGGVAALEQQTAKALELIPA